MISTEEEKGKKHIKSRVQGKVTSKGPLADRKYLELIESNIGKVMREYRS